MAAEAISGSGGSAGEGETMRLLAQQLESNLDLDEFLERAMASRGIDPTPGARLMLLIPLAEARDRGDFEQPQTYHSLTDLIEEMDKRPAVADKDLEARYSREYGEYGIVGRKPRSSVSAIKAFWTKFCNIPPFCGERDLEQ